MDHPKEREGKIEIDVAEDPDPPEWTQGQGSGASSDVIRTEPITANICSDVIKIEPVTPNISSDVIKTEPITANISSDVIKTEPITANISSNVIKTEPITADFSTPESITSRQRGVDTQTGDKQEYKRLSSVTHQASGSGQKPFTCDVCSEPFTQACDLKTHQVVHSSQRPFTCETCGETFTQTSALNNHKLLHTGQTQRLYTCDVCHKDFTCTASLEKHKRLHTGQRSFACDMCDKTFDHACHLKQHKLIHTGQRPFACELCDKTFDHACHLKQHKLIHTGQRPFAWDSSPVTRRETSQLGHLGSPMHPADVHLPTHRSDSQHSPSLGPRVPLPDTIALLQSSSGEGLALVQDGPVNPCQQGSLSVNLTQTRPMPQHPPPWEGSLGVSASGHPAPSGTAKPPSQGHRTFASHCTGPQATQASHAAHSAQDRWSPVSTGGSAGSQRGTQASSRRQGPLRPLVPIGDWPKGDDQVYFPSSRSWGHWSSAIASRDSAVWHTTSRRWVLVPPTIPEFADPSPPPVTHLPRQVVSPPGYFPDEEVSTEDAPFRPLADPSISHRPGPLRRSRADSIGGQGSGSYRSQSSTDLLKDKASRARYASAAALLEPVLPQFVVRTQSQERPTCEVPPVTHLPRQVVSPPGYFPDEEVSTEDAPFRPLADPSISHRPGPLRRSRADSIGGQGSGSYRSQSSTDLLKDKASRARYASAAALLEPVLPQFVVRTQSQERPTCEVPPVTHLPRQVVSPPGYFPDEEVSTEDAPFRPLADPSISHRPGPLRRSRADSIGGQGSGSYRSQSSTDLLKDEASRARYASAAALLEPVLPQFVVRTQSQERPTCEVLLLFGGPVDIPSSTVRLRTPVSILKTGKRLAVKARGGSPLPPPSSQEGHLCRSALPVGKYLVPKALRSRSSNDFEESSPLYWTSDPSPKDRLLLRAGVAPPRVDLSFEDLADWDRYIRSALASCGRAQHFICAMASTVRPTAHEEPDPKGGPRSPGAVSDDNILTFGRQAVLEVASAITQLSELHFNTILLRRDSFLRSSPLSPDEQNALRCIPPQDGSLFGEYGPSALRRHSEQVRESALIWAAAQSRRQAPKRAGNAQAPSLPAKKPRLVCWQGLRSHPSGQQHPPGAPNKKPSRSK